MLWTPGPAVTSADIHGQMPNQWQARRSGDSCSLWRARSPVSCTLTSALNQQHLLHVCRHTGVQAIANC